MGSDWPMSRLAFGYCKGINISSCITVPDSCAIGRTDALKNRVFFDSNIINDILESMLVLFA